MSLLHISQGTFRISDNRSLSIEQLRLRKGESIAFVGANGSGKSMLTRALAGELPLLTGVRCCTFQRLARLSFEQLQQLAEREWQRNNTDLLADDEQDSGLTCGQIIQQDYADAGRCQALAERFGIRDLLCRRFKYLSTGEARKALLCQALMGQPDLLILDEPFDGLDVASRQQLGQLLAQLHQQGYTLILVLNRFDEIPDFIQYLGVLAEGTLVEVGEKSTLLQQALIAQLAHSETLAGLCLPAADDNNGCPPLAEHQPRIVLRDAVVSYQDRPILHHLSWTVNPGEHWQITGSNGAGKSTLLSLVTGDHPQGYSNDLTLFGRRRGSGETIWDIKKYLGYVSSSLHLDYRVSTSLRNVILSGYFDSIGVYQAASDRQQKRVSQWLDCLGMDNAAADAPFHSLSWGQQRLALIVRALVKHPALLILDEPLQGLDSLNRQLVRQFIDILIGEGDTQLLFVSHHAQDAPQCITHRLRFIPQGDGYRYQTEIL